MKKRLILPALLLCAGMAVQAQQQQASAFYLRPAVSLRAPLQGDSINFKGDKFDMKELLKTKVNLDFDSYTYDRVEADTAGYVRVPIATTCSTSSPPTCGPNAS